jgi:hypothetical protein
MERIEIDFDVFKALTSLRDAESITYNDVVRELLVRLEYLKPVTKPILKLESTKPPTVPFASKGITFPHGTEFRAHYKGQVYMARVENGTIVFDNKSFSDRRFSSFSGAAVAITKHPVDGWIFWECRIPGEASWRRCNELRKA